MNKAKKNIVIFDGNPLHDWCKLFQEDGTELYIVQTSWKETRVVNYGSSGCLLTCAPIRESNGQVKKPETLSVRPDFVIVRNQPRGPTPEQDCRTTLYGLILSNVPAINSLESCFLDLERPVMVGQLKAIEKRLGHDVFPLVPLTYYDHPDSMVVYDGGFPSVIKVSHAHAGMGKAKVADMQGFEDMRTIMALSNDYCTAEPYIQPAYGIRVQKTGPTYRVYKKVMTGSGWKSHFGGADLQFIELNATFKLWADECAKCFGGIDLLAVDAICDVNGNMHILELNGSAIGIKAQFWEEDSMVIVGLCLDKMNTIYLDSQKPQLSQAQLSQVASDKINFHSSVSSAVSEAPKRSVDMFSFLSGMLVAAAITTALFSSRK